MPSFSSAGEDMMLRHVFTPRHRGFFVDVGAWQPCQANNTYRLYLQGWRGINIDARPGSMAEFSQVRPSDINVETAIGTDEGEAEYYHVRDASSRNSLDLDFASGGGNGIDGSEKVEVRRLDRVLDEHLPPGQAIDLLNVDVEGRDLDVLESNDWCRYRPTAVIVEDSPDGGTRAFLFERGYALVGFTPIVPGEISSYLLLDSSAPR